MRVVRVFMEDIKKVFLFVSGILASAFLMIAAILCAIGLASRFENKYVHFNPFLEKFDFSVLFVGFTSCLFLSYFVSRSVRNIIISKHVENIFASFKTDTRCPACENNFNRPSFDSNGKTICPLCSIKLKKPKSQKIAAFSALIIFNALILSKYLFGFSSSAASFGVVFFFGIYVFVLLADWRYEVDK